MSLDEGADPVDVGDDRQLFLDDLLVAEREGIRFDVKEPTPREVVLRFDRPWEGRTSWCPIVLRDDDRYRMWYRSEGQGPDGEWHFFTGYAESEDGIEWERPDLGQVTFEGRETNVCIDDEDVKNVAVFEDPRPDVPDDERYKAVGRWTSGTPSRIFGMVSPDGIEWDRVGDGALVTAPEDDPQFDSPLGAFWDPGRERYVIYVRGWYPDGPRRRVRAIRRTTSPDFEEWSDWAYVTIEGWDTWREHLYTNSAHRYYRAPVYLMFPKRFLPERRADPDRFPDWPHDGLSDVLLLASRDGERWTQVGDDAFLRPGHDPDNWHDRAVYVAPHAVPTGEGELSLYSVQNYRTERNHVRRFTLREDGFVSARAGHDGGTLLTNPLAVDGDRLEVNYATSAAGLVRIGLAAADGSPIHGYSTAACDDLIGDEIDAAVTWNGETALGDLVDRPLRLRIALEEADLFSFRFAST